LERKALEPNNALEIWKEIVMVLVLISTVCKESLFKTGYQFILRSVTIDICSL